MTIQYYANRDTNGNIIAYYNTDLWDIAKIPTTTVEITEAQWSDSVANPGKYIIANNALVLAPPPTAAKQLAMAQQNAITNLNSQAATTINGGFTSAALGAAQTYASTENDMVLFAGELAAVNDSTMNITSVPWNTVDAGMLTHTVAQFKQVYMDGRNFVQSNKIKLSTKVNQINQATAAAQVQMVAWPKNTNPPIVPTGLTGTAGTQSASLSWTANTDITMIGGGGYNIYENGAKINSALVTGTTFTAAGLTTGTSYNFSITAVDTDGNESAQCTTVSVKSN